MFRISGLNDSEKLSENEVWQIGREYIQTEERLIKARVDLSAAVVYENSLEIVPDEPPQKHANITPFSVENSPTDRKARRSIAIKLAHASKLVLILTE